MDLLAIWRIDHYSRDLELSFSSKFQTALLPPESRGWGRGHGGGPMPRAVALSGPTLTGRAVKAKNLAGSGSDLGLDVRGSRGAGETV